MKKNVLITGGNGAIGKEAVKFLSDKSDLYNITCLVHNEAKAKKRIGRYQSQMNFVAGDITKSKDLESVTKNVDFVIHLAAIIPPLADKKPDLAYEVNVVGTQNLIKAIEKNSPNAFFLYSSSISVYGDRVSKPNIKVGDPLSPSMDDEYGQTKVETEKLIQESNLDWTIFRLSGILDPKLNGPNPLMFHMPLETSFEICTTRDCGRAFVNALEHREQLSKRIFNLAGGESCRAIFSDFLNVALKLGGLGKCDFPEGAFAKTNFHCGYYVDGNDLEEIVHFQQDTKEDYFEMMADAIPEWQKISARLFRPIIKWGMLQTSDPWKAKRSKDKYGMKRYFGIDV